MLCRTVAPWSHQSSRNAKKVFFSVQFPVANPNPEADGPKHNSVLGIKRRQWECCLLPLLHFPSCRNCQGMTLLSTLDQMRHLNPCENWFWSRQGCDTEGTRVWRLLSVAAQNTMVWTTQSVEWSNLRLFSTAFTPGKRFELCEPPSSLSLWWTRSLPVGNHLLDYRDWKVHSQLVGATWHLRRRC